MDWQIPVCLAAGFVGGLAIGIFIGAKIMSQMLDRG